MIYLDTSVVLAQLLAEDRYPPESLWRDALVSSRLLEYEVWNRIHAAGLTESHSEATGGLLDRVAFLEMSPSVLIRATEPFPTTVRTLDALHLASIDFLSHHGVKLELASYDLQLTRAARQLGVEVAAL